MKKTLVLSASALFCFFSVYSFAALPAGDFDKKVTSLEYDGRGYEEIMDQEEETTEEGDAIQKDEGEGQPDAASGDESRPEGKTGTPKKSGCGCADDDVPEPESGDKDSPDDAAETEEDQAPAAEQ